MQPNRNDAYSLDGTPERLAAGAATASSTPTRGLSADRAERIAELYVREARVVQRCVARAANVPAAVLEDACQVAWTRLCAHTDVSLAPAAAISWLVITATREAWRQSRRRDVPVGVWLPDPEDPRELPPPARDSRDPLAVTLMREEARERLLLLTDREREFVAHQALGHSYDEIAQALGVTRRTVDRQLARARRKLRDATPDEPSAPEGD
jgi:RNA polymerase sigma factor (sigma-70 family)